MDSLYIGQSVFVIFLLWSVFIFARYNLGRTQKRVRYERQARGIALTRLFYRQRTPRLCGYHTGALLRPGQIAILDSNNCEVCNAD